MKSSAETRAAKMKYYDCKVTGYIAYINFWVWVILALSIADCIYGATIKMGILAGIGHMATLLLVMMAAILAREADTTAYWLNIGMLSWMILKSFLYMSYNSMQSVFVTTENVVGSRGISGAFSSLFSGIFSIAQSIFIMGLQSWCIILSIVYLVLFTKHKKFFLTSEKELKKEYNMKFEEERAESH